MYCSTARLLQNLLLPKYRLLQNLIQLIFYDTNTNTCLYINPFCRRSLQNSIFPMFPKFSQGNPKNIHRSCTRNKSRVSFGSDTSFNTSLSRLSEVPWNFSDRVHTTEIFDDLMIPNGFSSKSTILKSPHSVVFCRRFSNQFDYRGYATM